MWFLAFLIFTLLIAVGLLAANNYNPAVGEWINVNIVQRGQAWASSTRTAIVSSAFWQTYIAPTPNAFAIGCAATVVVIGFGYLAFRKKKITLPKKPSITTSSLSSKINLQREPAEPEPAPVTTAKTGEPVAPVQKAEEGST